MAEYVSREGEQRDFTGRKREIACFRKFASYPYRDDRRNDIAVPDSPMSPKPSGLRCPIGLFGAIS